MRVNICKAHRLLLVHGIPKKCFSNKYMFWRCHLEKVQVGGRGLGAVRIQEQKIFCRGNVSCNEQQRRKKWILQGIPIFKGQAEEEDAMRLRSGLRSKDDSGESETRSSVTREFQERSSSQQWPAQVRSGIKQSCLFRWLRRQVLDHI